MREATPVILESTITRPNCGTAKAETMPTDACQFFFDCIGCGELLRPKPGDRCVFCSYGSIPCPPIQAGETPTCRPHREDRTSRSTHGDQLQEIIDHIPAFDEFKTGLGDMPLGVAVEARPIGPRDPRLPNP